MKLCRNCRTINEDNVKACARCKMRDQLVDYNPELTREWQNTMRSKNNVQRPINVCKNCGTPEYGEGTKCARCNFPLKLKERASDESTNNRKA